MVMRIVVPVLPALIVGLTQAHASIGYSCTTEDANVKFTVAGAYGTSLGGGAANFGGEIEINLAGVPDGLRKIRLDLSHLGQDWFYDRDLKLLARWQRPMTEPFGEVIVIVDTRRGETEESQYLGNYELVIEAAPADGITEGTSLHVRGTVTC